METISRLFHSQDCVSGFDCLVLAPATVLWRLLLVLLAAGVIIAVVSSLLMLRIAVQDRLQSRKLSNPPEKA